MTDTTAERDARAKSKNLSALRGLWPFIRPYRKLLIVAIVALVSTAAITLALPLAVRRVVDGFEAREMAMLNQYFGAALGLAGAVSTWHGVAVLFRDPLG